MVSTVAAIGESSRKVYCGTKRTCRNLIVYTGGNGRSAFCARLSAELAALLNTVILRPGVGRRISRDAWD